jgi:CBS domain-containing protein
MRDAAQLKRFAPLASLPEAEYGELVAGSREQSYAAGEVILHEDGTPSEHLYVIASGSIELTHDDDVIDVLEPGEAFGHPSLLSGMAPAFDVRAREPSVCLLIGPELARSLLSRPAGLEFVASSLRERMVRTGYVAHAQGDVRTAHLGSLVHRPVAVVTPHTTARDAARIMAEADISCVLVRLDDAFGVVTDSDLRRKLVARGLDSDTPVAELMAAPAITFQADRLAVDAMIDMLDAGIHHLPVVDARGTPLGVVTATDLMYLESRTPFALRRSIAHAGTADEVAEAARHLPQTIVALIKAGVNPTDIGRVVALTGDTATMRLIDLAFTEHGPAPDAWAWMALGSTARREASLASDQDNALAYADGGDDAWFERVAASVNAGLAACGFGADNAEVLARNRLWRMSRADWVRVFNACLEQPDHSHLIRAAVAFDFRHVWGALRIVPPLVEIERRARDHPYFLRRLARTATDFKPPLGFRKTIQVDDADGAFDVKKGAIVPICNLARFHALSAGVTISSTLERLHAAEAEGTLEPDPAAELREAFELVTRLRLEHQAAQAEAGQPADNRLAPGALPPLTRAQLRAALRSVDRAQHRLSRYVPIGI